MDLDYSRIFADSFWMTLVLHFATLFPILTFTYFYCCKKKAKEPKNGNQQEPVGEGVKHVKPPENQVVEEVSIRTDKTQEQTESTQDFSNVGEEQLPDISPYPYEIFTRGFFGKKRKKHIRQGNEGVQQTRIPKRTTRHNQRVASSIPNNNNNIEIESTNPAVTPSQPAEAISKPMSDREKVPSKAIADQEKVITKEKSITKASLHIPHGTDVTQSAVCSTQPSNLPMDSNVVTIYSSENKETKNY